MKRAAIILAALGLLFVSRGAYIFAKARLAQILLRRAWTRTLAGEASARPWPWADTTPMAILTLRGRDFVVLEGANGRNLAFAPSHLERSAMPGEDGNCVMSAHRDTHFTVLQDVQRGERIVVQRRDGRRFAYDVEETRIVDRHDGWIAQDRGAPVLTLITCWPFDAVTGGGAQRYVVVARRANHPGNVAASPRVMGGGASPRRAGQPATAAGIRSSSSASASDQRSTSLARCAGSSCSAAASSSSSGFTVRSASAARRPVSAS
ncbi:MAG TPA: class GN sortase [Thermoanaerobaculia bacterium]|jgi:sortase A|nr:class GN sortase [Thermoanaerobaculia bacterium]